MPGTRTATQWYLQEFLRFRCIRRLRLPVHVTWALEYHTLILFS